ncbi:MAG: PP2C family protein-serine/threonine phosphatase, partial [Flavobacteriales bacterium]|nr:PP2C family protein-serine/threonine phosphatase [Flavobacteriales bacterium]
ANVPTEKLLALYQQTLRDSLGIGKLILFAKQETWECVLKFGIDGEIPNVTDEAFFNQKSAIGLDVKGATEKETFDIVIPVDQDGVPIAYLLVGDSVEDQIRMSPVIKHMRFIQTLTNVIMVAIQNKRLVEEKIHQERVAKELELAAEMQALLVPHKMPSNELYELSAVYKPHQQVGGDYYDFFTLNDEEMVMCMADVSGKGVSAAFLMANFQAYLRSIFKMEKISLETVIKELNDQVMNSARGEKYITFFVAKCNTVTGVLEYINCGHNPPVLCHEDGSSELLSLGSIGLGMFEEIPTIKKGSLELQRNDVLVCYTDGLVELENEAQQEFGLEKLEEFVLTNFGCTMQDLNRKIMSELEDYRGTAPYIDDTALLSCRFHAFGKIS